MKEKRIPQSQLHKMLEERRRSFPLRVENHARSVLLQRELRRRMAQHIRDAENEHIGVSPVAHMGESALYMNSLRRELLLRTLGT